MTPTKTLRVTLAAVAATALGAVGGLVVATPAGALGGTVPTQTTVVPSANPSVTGQAVTFTANVAESDGGNVGTPTGTVEFSVVSAAGKMRNCHGGDIFKLQNGSATCSVDFGLFVRGAPYHVTAVYSGDVTFVGSTSSPVLQGASPAPSVTHVTSKHLSVVEGKPAKVVVKVAGNPPVKVKRTGVVVITITGSDHSVVHCEGTDNPALAHSGGARCKIAAGDLKVSASPYTVQVQYSGDVDYLPSSGSLTIMVNPAPPALIIPGSRSKHHLFKLRGV